MKTDGCTTGNVWFATLLSYLGYELARVATLDSHKSEWTFVIPSEDAKILRDEYDSDAQTIYAKAFVEHFNRLSKQQREMRRDGESEWCGPAWIAGRVK